MKTRYIIYSLFTFLLFPSCENEVVVKPNADFTISETVVSVNETVTFTYTGSEAKQVVIYTGDEGHDYQLKEQSNSGVVLSKGILTYAYKKQGTYKVVLIATNYDKEGNESLYSAVEKEITVVDDRVDLQEISLKRDLFNKQLLGQINGNDILFVVPYKIRISGKDIAVDITKQRLEISTSSDAAQVSVNGDAYNTSTKYDLSQPVTLNILAPSGQNKAYSIETMRYAVFENFSINGIAGEISYSDFNFEKTYISVTLPSGTDVSALTPAFSSNDAKSITIGGTEQISGESVVDFTQPVTYVLKTWKDGNEEQMYAESEVEIEVIVE